MGSPGRVRGPFPDEPTSSLARLRGGIFLLGDEIEKTRNVRRGFFSFLNKRYQGRPELHNLYLVRWDPLLVGGGPSVHEISGSHENFYWVIPGKTPCLTRRPSRSGCLIPCEKISPKDKPNQMGKWAGSSVYKHGRVFEKMYYSSQVNLEEGGFDWLSFHIRNLFPRVVF